eukprot:2030986-Amphidinium_carterae.1
MQPPFSFGSGATIQAQSLHESNLLMAFSNVSEPKFASRRHATEWNITKYSPNIHHYVRQVLVSEVN